MEKISKKIQMDIPTERLTEFCNGHSIQKLSLFGSVLREDFRPDSDLDLLVEFEPNAKLSLFDLAQMEEDLTEILGRKVDLVEASALRNPFRRYEIIRTQQVIYAH